MAIAKGKFLISQLPNLRHSQKTNLINKMGALHMPLWPTTKICSFQAQPE
jgi:hypothetical protein